MKFTTPERLLAFGSTVFGLGAVFVGGWVIFAVGSAPSRLWEWPFWVGNVIAGSSELRV
ncbi:hypothetical protein [Arthrobacter sp. SDTb3-6]|uniref:hypothetical protein n=1 Tax=Arthrobacter sp. SDTb3-6 TaxID=2713571 RepID=UPI00159D5139|nr:hypothetical protein [Arthrobacter sp. SDTb3-6]NVN00693.1 hypothetical protein [Arthrobacter sp. SDTb3-6]